MASRWSRAIQTFLLLSQLAISAPQVTSTSSTASAAAPTTAYFTFPVGTDVENLAVRTNGGILANLVNEPEIAYVDPAKLDEAAPIIARFAAPADSVLGITELPPGSDIFYVVTSSFDPATLSPRADGTGQIWKVQITDEYEGGSVEGSDGAAPGVNLDLVTTVAGSGLLNGITGLSDCESPILLVADSTKALIWSVNARTAETVVAIRNAETDVDSAATFPLGPNGVHTRGSHAYWTNTALSEYVRVRIDRNGSAIGEPEVLAKGDDIPTPDDFDFATSDGPAAFVANAAPANVVYIDENGHTNVVLSPNTRPTAIRVDAIDKSFIWISTAGNSTVGGDIFKYYLSHS